MPFKNLRRLAGYPLRGNHQFCLIRMKYRIIMLIIITSSLGQILLSYIANTSRTHALTHALTHARTHALTHARTHASTLARTLARTHAHGCARSHARTLARAHTHTHAHRHRRRTGYRYSLAPNRDAPLRWRNCLSLAIEINTAVGFPEVLGVFGV